MKRDEGKIRNERLADSIISNNTRDLWSEIKLIRSNKCGPSRTVDGRTEGISIAKLFADKYKDLYTSVPYDSNELNCIQAEIKDLLESTSTCSDCFFNFSEVKYAVSRLKAHKNDGCSTLTSDHFINAGNDCLVHIALLFTAMAFHDTAPDNFLCSSIIPIPKGNKGNVTDSNNFRGIMLSSIFFLIV